MQRIVLKKIFCKLMNSSVFGKTMENLRKRIRVKLIINPKDYIRCVSKPIFISQKIFGKNIVAIHEIKPVMTLNKLVYVRFSILDLSKLLIYEFPYKYIKSKFVEIYFMKLKQKMFINIFIKTKICLILVTVH